MQLGLTHTPCAATQGPPRPLLLTQGHPTTIVKHEWHDVQRTAQVLNFNAGGKNWDETANWVLLG